MGPHTPSDAQERAAHRWLKVAPTWAPPRSAGLRWHQGEMRIPKAPRLPTDLLALEALAGKRIA